MTDLLSFVSEISPKIGALGSAFYFDPATRVRAEELGLGSFRFYVLGRGGVLGDVDPALVVSAFGYFDPEGLSAQWEKGRAILDPPSAAREYFACCAALGRTKLSGLAGLEELVEALETARSVADPAGLALYAGIATLALADDPPARALQLIAQLREFRGSAHLVAVLASLLEPRIAHYIRRPEMFEFFGYRPEQVPLVTDEHRAQLAAADAITDRMVARAWAVLDERQQAAVTGGLAAIEQAFAPD